MTSLSLGYVYFLNMRRKKTLGDYNADNQYQRAAAIVPETVDHHLSAIKNQMDGRAIDAVTECMHITNLGRQAASAAKTAAKTLAWAAVGVKARYHTADHACYLVLSGDELHYLFFEEGAMKEHLIFDRYRLQHARLEHASGTDRIARVYTSGGIKTQKLILDIEGKKMEILFYNRINRLPGGPLSFMQKDVFRTQVDFEIMGKYFKEQLGHKYPQLVVS